MFKINKFKNIYFTYTLQLSNLEPKPIDTVSVYSELQEL